MESDLFLPIKKHYQAHWLPSVLFHQAIFCYPSVFFKFLLTQNKRQKPSSYMRAHAHTYTHTHSNETSQSYLSALV